MQNDIKTEKTDREHIQELYKLLSNAIYIFEKAEHFNAGEIEDMATWIYTTQKARAAG